MFFIAEKKVLSAAKRPGGKLKSSAVKLTALSALDKEAAAGVITVTAVVDGVEYDTYVTIKQ